MDFTSIIRTDPAVRSGKRVIRDTEITVTDGLEYLSSGMSEVDIRADFPDLKRVDIGACPAFAAAREKRVLSAVA
jgi:uncharacterized protein (DUF433 family)